jgi:hypothetical protein
MIPAQPRSLKQNIVPWFPDQNLKEFIISQGVPPINPPTPPQITIQTVSGVQDKIGSSSLCNFPAPVHMSSVQALQIISIHILLLVQIQVEKQVGLQFYISA